MIKSNVLRIILVEDKSNWRWHLDCVGNQLNKKDADIGVADINQIKTIF